MSRIAVYKLFLNNLKTKGTKGSNLENKGRTNAAISLAIRNVHVKARPRKVPTSVPFDSTILKAKRNVSSSLDDKEATLHGDVS